MFFQNSLRYFKISSSFFLEKFLSAAMCEKDSIFLNLETPNLVSYINKGINFDLPMTQKATNGL